MRSSDTATFDSPPDAAVESTERSDAAASPGISKDAGLIGKRYEVQCLLGQGGMGAVYRAHDRLTGQLVALKRVALDRVSGPNTERSAARPQLPESATPGAPISPGSQGSTISGPRALRIALAQEFRTLASLRHPNIVSVLDYGFDHEHLPFFTMECLENPQNLLHASLQLPLVEKLELIAQLLRALTYLHRHSILHRDLKPSNIQVVREADTLRLKVLDFGIAVQVGATRDIAGTIAYMAPEVRQGEPPTPAADLYAVGVILYQMLTRQLRRGQTSTMTLLPEAAAGEPTELTLSVALPAPPAAESPPAAPSASDRRAAESASGPIDGAEWRPNLQLIEGPLAEVVARLVAPDPQSRYQDAAAVLHDLSQVMSKIAARPLAKETVAARDSFLQAAELVGRERELAQLTAALAAARRGTGSVLLVGGESGSGKSRLLEELRTTALVRGVRAMRGQAVSDGGTAYQIFSDVLPQLVLELPLSDLEASVLKELVSELPTLLGRPVPDAVPLSPQAAQQRLHQVLQNTLTGCLEPVVLLLEDLHWAAPESLELLKELAEQVSLLPLLIVASYRDDERADLPQLFPAAAVLKLPRLTSAGIAALSYAMLGAPGTRPEIVAFLERETEGNVGINYDASVVVEQVVPVADAAGQAVELEDDQGICRATRKTSERRLKRRPVERLGGYVIHNDIH